MFAETAKGLLVLAHLMMPVNQGAQLATVTTTSTTTTTVAASGATNYSTSCGLVYTFESETNGDPADATGSAAAACDGTDNGTINRTTGIQGSTAASFTSGVEYFSITNADCLNYIDSGSGGSKTWVYLVTPTGSPTSARSVTGDYNGSIGYLTRIQSGDGVSAAGKVEFRVGATNKVSTTNLQVGTTYAIAGVYDSTGPTEKLYVNASQEDSTGTTALADATPASMKLGSSSTNLTATVDDFAICNFAATAAQLCQIASCGIDGSGCTCSGATYTDTGLNSTFGCSLTGQDCNAAAP